MRTVRVLAASVFAVFALAASACRSPRQGESPRVDTLTVSVPMRRGGDARTVTLPVIRMRAAGPPRGVVFWFGGGPGQSNLNIGAARAVHDDFDVVRVGYRGADGTPGLACPEVSEAFRAVADPMTDVAIRVIGDATAHCRNRLAGQGVDVDGYTTLEVVDDADAVRQRLGYDRVAVVGESYGTRLAYLYAARHPAHVERVVLLGANPPGRMLWSGHMSDSLLGEFAKRWDRAHPSAPLMEAFRRVNANFPRRWLGMPIHAGAVRAASFAFLFETQTAALVFDAWTAAARGDASGLWLLSLAAHFVFPTIVNWGDNAAMAVSADHVPGADYRAMMLPEGHVFGAPLGYLLWATASRWPMAPLPAEWRVMRRVDTPTLIIDGNLDITTPAGNATHDLLPNMPNARLIVLRDAGHLGDMWGGHAIATTRLVRSFLATGVADTSLMREIPADLPVRRGYPTVAKLIVAAVILLVAVVVAGAWFGGRRIAARRRAARSLTAPG